MTASVSFLGDNLGDNLGDVLGDFSPVTTLLSWADGTFVNSLSGRTLWAPTDGILYGPFSSGVAATATIDGVNYYQSEGAATNDVDDSEDFTAWGSLGSETVGANAGASPEAGEPLTADSITFTASASDGVSTTIAGVADSKKASASVWARTTSGTKGFRIQILLKDGTTATSTEQTATTVYQRFDFVANALSGGTTPEMRILNDAGATAGVALFWGAMADDGGGGGVDYASSYVKTSGAPVTRPADVMSFSAAQIPAVMRDGKWEYNLLMRGTYQEGPTATPPWIDFNFGASPSDRGCRFGRNTGARTQLFSQRDATTFVVTPSSVATWSRDQTVTTKLDTVGGSITLEGLTAGNGTTTGTSWSGFVLLTDDLMVGKRFDNVLHPPVGLIGEPRPW